MSNKQKKHNHSGGRLTAPATPVQRQHPRWLRALAHACLSTFRFPLFTVFFLLTWLWASWWMGDIGRMAYEYSFFAPDKTLMHWLWQQPFGVLWILGRALLLTYRWPLLGGLAVALLLTVGTELLAYCLRLPRRWRCVAYLPAGAWMAWVAWQGLNLYYMHEPGRAFGVLLLAILVCAVDAFVIWTFKSRRRGLSGPSGPSPDPSPVLEGSSVSSSRAREGGKVTSTNPKSPLPNRGGAGGGAFIILLLCFAIPLAITHYRYPYARPVTKMQVLMMRQDWNGMAESARENAHLSYRPLAAYYAIALVHNGRLADDLFAIRMDYDSLYMTDRSFNSDVGTNYYLCDGNFHAGLVRPTTHRAMEQLTMDGPSLVALKHLTRCALIDGHWQLARKYLHIIGQTPFEGDFINKYSAMIEHPELVKADPEFEQVLRTAPLQDSFESMYEEPVFLGYTVNLMEGRSMDALTQSLMANLYSKRMPMFLMRCEPLVGTTPAPLIAQGLVTQARKNPEIMQAFPSLQMEMQRFVNFLRAVQPYMQDRPRGGVELFDQYRGYYPYYYFFGNLKATRKRDTNEASSAAGVN